MSISMLNKYLWMNKVKKESHSTQEPRLTESDRDSETKSTMTGTLSSDNKVVQSKSEKCILEREQNFRQVKVVILFLCFLILLAWHVQNI